MEWGTATERSEKGSRMPTQPRHTHIALLFKTSVYGIDNISTGKGGIIFEFGPVFRTSGLETIPLSVLRGQAHKSRDLAKSKVKQNHRRQGGAQKKEDDHGYGFPPPPSDPWEGRPAMKNIPPERIRELVKSAAFYTGGNGPRVTRVHTGQFVSGHYNILVGSQWIHECKKPMHTLKQAREIHSRQKSNRKAPGEGEDTRR